MSDIVVKIIVDSNQAQAAAKSTEKAIERVTEAGKRNAKQNREQSKTFEEINRAIRLVQGPLDGVASRFQTLNSIFNEGSIRAVAFTLGIAGLTASLVKYFTVADRYSQLSARLQLVTKGTIEFANAQDQLFRIAQETRSSLETTTDAFISFQQSLQNVGLSQQAVLQFTETLQKSFRLAGTSAQNQSAAILQLGQAFAKGKLDGDEFRSVLENNKLAAQILADQLTNGNRGALFELSRTGKLTAQEVAFAFIKASDDINASFAKIPLNASQGLTLLQNSFFQLVGQIEDATGISNKLGEALKLLANNLSAIVQAAVAAAAVFSLSFIPALVAGARTVQLFSATIIASTQAVLAFLGPFGLIAAAVASAIIYFGDWRTALAATGAVVIQLGAYIAQLATTIAGVLGGALNGILDTFNRAGQVLAAFGSDIANFVRDPLAGADFSGTQSAYKKAVDGLVTDVYDSTVTQIKQVNQEIQVFADSQIAALGRFADKSRATLSNSAESAPKQAAAVTAEVKKQKEAAKEFTEEQKRQIEYFKQQEEAAKQLSDSIRDGISDAIFNGFNGSGNFLKDFFQRLKTSFIRSIADGIAGAIQRGFIDNVTRSVFGVGGGLPKSLGGTGVASGGGATGSLSSLSGASSIFSGLLKGFNTPFLTTGQAANIGGFLGAGTGFSGNLLNFTPGAGIASFAGNFLADKLLGNRGVGSSIGGTIGGLGGTFFGGPIGGAVGSFLGNAIGGLFGGGGKPSSRLRGGKIDLSTGNIETFGLTGKKFSQENADAVTAIGQFATTISQLFGVQGKINSPLIAQASDRYGFQYAFGSNQDTAEFKSFKTADELFQALTVEFATLAGKSEELKNAFAKIDFSKTEQAVSDINFVLWYESIGKAVEPASELKTALDELNKKFDTNVKTAERLGLSIDKVNKEREREITNLRNQANASVFGEILGIVNPGAGAVLQEIDRYKTQLQNIKDIGGDLQQVELLHKLRLLEIEQQYGTTQQENITKLENQQSQVSKLADEYAAISKSLGDAIFNLRIGSLSPVSPLQKLNEARSQFQNLAALAQQDTPEGRQAASELASLGNQFLELSRAYNASSQAFVDDFNLVEQGLRAAKSVADLQLITQQSMLSTLNQQLEVARTGFSALQAEIAKLFTPVAGKPLPGIPEGYSGGAYSASNPNEIVLRNFDAIKNAGLYNSVESLLTQFTPGVVSGGGRRSAFFEANPLYAAQFMQAAKLAGIPGFAAGGMIGSGRLAMVGENGPELLQFDRPAFIRPMAANDNGAFSSSISDLMRQNSLNTQAVIGVLNRMVNTLDDVRREQRVANERR